MTLSRAEFADRLSASEVTWWLEETVGTDGTGAGAAVRVARGTRLWGGSITVNRDTDPYRMREIEAVIDRLQGPGQAFLIAPPFAHPANDRTGALLSGASPTVEVDSSGAVQLNGLPDGYVLAQGDFIGWSYGTPTRRALHRIYTGGAASGAGALQVEVEPPAVPVSTRALTLMNPAIRAVLVPDTLAGFGYRPGVRDGATFAFRQVLP